MQEDLGLLHKVLSIETQSASHTDVPRKAIRSSGIISQDKIGHDSAQICLVLRLFWCLFVCFKLNLFHITFSTWSFSDSQSSI